jgi:hypothetical protein
MRKTHPKSDQQPSKTALPGPAQRRLPSEWPLLVYPVLFLTTLAILYAVNRSIEKESPAPLNEQRTAQEQATTSGRLGNDATGNHAKLTSGLSSRSRQGTEATG